MRTYTAPLEKDPFQVRTRVAGLKFDMTLIESGDSGGLLALMDSNGKAWITGVIIASGPNIQEGGTIVHVHLLSHQDLKNRINSNELTLNKLGPGGVLNSKIWAPACGT